MHRKKSKYLTSSYVVFIVVAMLGIGFLSVPLYKTFCSLTGWGGTTRQGEYVDEGIGKRTIKVLFDSNQDRGLKIKFTASQNEQTVNIGQAEIAYFSVENLSDKPLKIIASYNVNPSKAGKYFTKINCFCFSKQSLEVGQKLKLPVYYFIDKKIDKDKYLDDTSTIILSYMFHEVK